MNKPKPNRYTKLRIAEIQLERAVRLLTEENDPVCALTLAGAAEEILGKMVKQKGEATAFDDWAAYDRSFWEFAKEQAAFAGKSLSPPDDATIRRRLNVVRNEFKHNDKGKNTPVKADYRWEAEDMILRAVRNFIRLYNKPPRSQIIYDWWDDLTR